MDSRRLVRAPRAGRARLRGWPLVRACSATSAATPKRWRRCATPAATSARCTRTTTGRSRRSVRVGYGAKYARYDYLADRGPVEPARQHRDQAVAARQPEGPRDRCRIARSRPAPKSSCRRRSACGCRRSGPSRTSRTRRSGPSVSITSRWRSNAHGRAASSSACARFGSASTIRSSRCSASRSPTAGAASVTITSARPATSMRRLGRQRQPGVGDHVRAAVDYTQANTEWRRWSPDRGRARTRGAIGAARRRAHSRRDGDVRKHRRADRDAAVLLYKVNTAFDAPRTLGAVARHERALQRAGQSVAAVPELHERAVGDAGRGEQPVPGRLGRQVGLRRAARGAAAEARARRRDVRF